MADMILFALAFDGASWVCLITAVVLALALTLL